MNILTQSDPVHIFDQRPSHAPRPSWVSDAADGARRAWDQHDDAVEDYLAGKGSHQAIQAALKAAKEQQAYADDMLAAWLNGYEPESVRSNVSIDITVYNAF